MLTSLRMALEIYALRHTACTGGFGIPHHSLDKRVSYLVETLVGGCRGNRMIQPRYCVCSLRVVLRRQTRIIKQPKFCHGDRIKMLLNSQWSVPIRYSIWDHNFCPSLIMIHILPYQAQCLVWRDRKWVDMSSRPAAAKDDMITLS